MKHTDVPFNEIKMCMIILHDVPLKLSTTYWANKGVGNFPTEMRALIDDLALLEPKYQCTQKNLEQV